METSFFRDPQQLIPAIIQDFETKNVLMLGYMNLEAFEITVKEKYITFFSRSKQRIWTKGETSGNKLVLVSFAMDCDKDTFLFQVRPLGPTCHKGTDTCWQMPNNGNYGFISTLEDILAQRLAEQNPASYTYQLLKGPIAKAAQKVGEEAVELVIEAMQAEDALFREEAADLLFHYILLLKKKNISFDEIVLLLQKRNEKKQ